MCSSPPARRDGPGSGALHVGGALPGLGRDVAEVRGGGGRGPRIGEPQHRIQQDLLTLRGARRHEPIDEAMLAGGRRKWLRADVRKVSGVRQHRGTEPEPAGHGRVDFPRTDDVVGHALGLDQHSAQRVARDAQRLARLRGVRPDVELADVDRRTRRSARLFHRRTVDRRGTRCRQQRHRNKRDIREPHSQKATVRDTKYNARPTRCPKAIQGLGIRTKSRRVTRNR